MKHIIQFHVSKGDTYYVAEGVDLPIVTQALTLDELARNVQEAVELQLDGEASTSFGLSDEPSVLMNFELPVLDHA